MIWSFFTFLVRILAVYSKIVKKNSSVPIFCPAECRNSPKYKGQFYWVGWMLTSWFMWTFRGMVYVNFQFWGEIRQWPKASNFVTRSSCCTLRGSKNTRPCENHTRFVLWIAQRAKKVWQNLANHFLRQENTCFLLGQQIWTKYFSQDLSFWLSYRDGYYLISYSKTSHFFTYKRLDQNVKFKKIINFKWQDDYLIISELLTRCWWFGLSLSLTEAEFNQPDFTSCFLFVSHWVTLAIWHTMKWCRIMGKCTRSGLWLLPKKTV